MSVKIWMSDTFTGTTIDTAKWAETDPNSRIAQNNTLTIANAHSVTRLMFTDKLTSVATISSNVISVQADLTWTTDGNSEAEGALILYKDANNFAEIGSRTTAGGVYGLRVKQGGTNRYGVDTVITKGKTVKITFNVATTEIKFWYWNTDVWTQMGATQTYDIGTPLYALLSSEDDSGYNGANPAIFDNVYFVQGNYLVNPPVNKTDGGSFLLNFL